MSELPKAYEAKNVDRKWYAFWEQNNFFSADPNSTKPPYSLVIPPPNVTGVLHMGHALVNSLQDILIRWKRMSGYEALWIPGTDHAGIATQTVVERHLIKTVGKKRNDFSREEFLGHIWKWKESSETRIIDQLKKLGCSCDWSKIRFTMDEGNNQAVRTTFKKLYDQGLIYRGDYLVNWDPVTQTALADDEVEYEERESFLWHFNYPLEDQSGHITIATTRPETMLGDTAVAVSPRDERYRHLIGKNVILPLMDRPIPIIEDHHVDPEFGTGLVKITPAHDPNDYQMGLNHRLPFINILTPDGKINENGGQFVGLTITEARKAVVEEMKSKGLIEKIEPHIHRVGISYRSKAVIEPYMSKQWFIRMDSFGKQMREAVTLGKTKLIPQHWESTYFHWIDNLRDWCISRQLWWGHRIPIWYHVDDSSRIICHDGEDLPPEVRAAPDEWIQDADVLDTWFSSALWPFAALGWPEKTPELKKFYPISVLVTGHDILFFWVARMIMMGQYIMDEVPFPETFLHGLIYGKSYWRTNKEGGITYVSEEEQLAYDLGQKPPNDVISKWEKMSKSKGNIIDPLEMIDQYGTDAVRMALCASTTKSRQIDLDRRRFEEFKNFANKIWNGARFVLMNLEGEESQGTTPLTLAEFSEGTNEATLALEDRWILSVLNRTVKEVNTHLSTYTFDQAAMEAYDFFWKEFCAFYVEIAKPTLFGKIGSPEERKNKQKLLLIILCQTVRLLHPIAPFITEELFQIIKDRMTIGSESNMTISKSIDPYTQECLDALSSPSCMTSIYPQVTKNDDINPEIEASFALIEQAVYTIRNIRGEMKLPPKAETDIYIVGESSDPDLESVRSHSDIISALIRTKGIHIQFQEPKIGSFCTGILNNLKIILPLPEEMLKQERVRLTKEREKIAINFEKLSGQLSNADFTSRAPEALVKKMQGQMEQAERELREIETKLAAI